MNFFFVLFFICKFPLKTLVFIFFTSNFHAVQSRRLKNFFSFRTQRTITATLISTCRMLFLPNARIDCPTSNAAQPVLPYMLDVRFSLNCTPNDQSVLFLFINIFRICASRTDDNYRSKIEFSNNIKH